MIKKLILSVAILLFGNRLESSEIVAYRDRNIQEIVKAVDDICTMTEQAGYQNPKIRAAVKNLSKLKDYSRSIVLAFESMDVCVTVEDVLSEKIAIVKQRVGDWISGNFSNDSTTRLFQALDDFETIYYGRWSETEEPLLLNSFFCSIQSRIAKEQLERVRDISKIRREIKKEDMLAAADIAEAHKRIIEANTKANQTLATSNLTIEESITILGKSIEENKLAIETAKQKREFLPYEADFQVIKNCYELAEKHMALLKSKTELEQSKADLEKKRVDILKAKTEIEKARAEAEKALAEARYAEVQQEIAKQKAEIEMVQSLVTLGNGIVNGLANYADKQPKIKSLSD